MTVSTQYQPFTFKPGAAMAAEAIPWQFLAGEQIVVTHIDAVTAVETVLVLGDDYSVGGSGPDGTGSVTALAAWPVDDDFRVERTTSLEQEYALPPFEALQSSQLERENDRQLMALQEIDKAGKSLESRALRVPKRETIDEIPNVEDRANTYLAFDMDGNPIPSLGTGADAGLRADLASAIGAAMVGFTRPSIGAVARSSAAKFGDFVHAKDFGVVGDGVADDFPAYQAALDSMFTGGTLYTHGGKFKFSDECFVKHGGITIQGVGGVDYIRGAPPPTALGSYFFQTTPGKGIFVFGPGTDSSSVKDCSFGATLVPTTPPELTGKFAIKITGALPAISWSYRVNDCFFFNVEYGIIGEDTDATPASDGQDFSVAPVDISGNSFIGPRVSILLNTNNADFWIIDRNRVFPQPDCDGIVLKRYGMLHILNTLTGNDVRDNNNFIKIEGTGLTSTEKILINHCQGENLENFLIVMPGVTSASMPEITIENTILELNSNIKLGSGTRLKTRNNRFSNMTIEVDHADCRLSTNEDDFVNGADYDFNAGSPIGCFVNTIWGDDPSPLYGSWKFEAGKLVSRKGLLTAVPNATTTPLFSFQSQEVADYSIYATLPGNGAAFTTCIRVGSDGSTFFVAGGDAMAANVTISWVGLDVSVFQNTGVPQDIAWNFRRAA